MNLDDANKLWCEFQPIESVKFGLNDSVQIISGEYGGQHANVVSLISLEPITYLMELAFGGEDLIATESELELEEKHIR